MQLNIQKRWTYFERKRMRESGALQKGRVQKQFKFFLKGKTSMEVTPEDIVGFLISKEMEGLGRTLVQKEECKNLGSQELRGCKIEECGFRYAYDSLRSGYFEKLKGLFEEGMSGK